MPKKTHRLRSHPIYGVWSNMLYMCSNPNAANYANYGGRGIKVCDRWLSSDLFFEDMLLTWKEGLQLDRINNDGDYEPSNCQWNTRSANTKNRRISVDQQSRYDGVIWNSQTNSWMVNFRRSHFADDKDAAIFLDKIMDFVDKDKAHINLPDCLFDMKSDLVPVVLTLNDVYWAPYALSALEGYFDKIVIYDAGSSDGTLDVLRWFKRQSKTEVILEEFPFVPPKAQLAFRNAPIVELGHANYYLIVDTDEIWTPESLEYLRLEYPIFAQSKLPYGVVRRIEIVESLTQAYGVDSFLPHHRLYKKDIVKWRQTHPGERAEPKQSASNEYVFSNDVKVMHFHNTLRSPKENITPGRQERKQQGTYHRGPLLPFDVLKELPILLQRFEDFPVNPSLQILQEKSLGG